MTISQFLNISRQFPNFFLQNDYFSILDPPILIMQSNKFKGKVDFKIPNDSKKNGMIKI